MDQKAKRKMAANAVYILTAVIVVSIMCMTLYSAFNSANRRSESEVLPDASPDNEDVLNEPDPMSPTAPVYTPETDSSVLASNPANEPAEPTMNGETGSVDALISPPLYTPPTYIMPVNGAINKSFDDNVPVFSMTMNDYRVHTGIDIDAEVGCAVFACADGVITNIYNDPFWGSCITVSHSEGLTSHYMNLSTEFPPNIDEGVTVSQGDIIGVTGDTALIEMADSDHLHFEMRLSGTAVNPLSYIPYEVDAIAVVNVE
ncbi:MAG: peptidoglycan DD-metalloendopeptidase family protein [Eubacteriales bacterium]